MLKYTIRRMIYVLPTLWAVVTFVFFLIRIVPGGPAVAALGSYATAESIRQLEKLGPCASCSVTTNDTDNDKRPTRLPLRLRGWREL